MNDGYFQYTDDANGNAAKMITDDGDEVNLTYDSRNGIFKNLNLPKWTLSYILDYSSNMNNNATSISIESVDFPEDNDSFTINYEYNAENYPTKMTMISTEDEPFTQTVEYILK